MITMAKSMLKSLPKIVKKAIANGNATFTLKGKRYNLNKYIETKKLVNKLNQQQYRIVRKAKKYGLTFNKQTFNLNNIYDNFNVDKIKKMRAARVSDIDVFSNQKVQRDKDNLLLTLDQEKYNTQDKQRVLGKISDREGFSEYVTSTKERVLSFVKKQGKRSF